MDTGNQRSYVPVKANVVVARGKEELGSIDMTRLQHLDNYKSEIKKHAIDFQTTFALLLAVMNTTEESESKLPTQKSTSQTSLPTSQKRTITPPTSSSPNKRFKSTNTPSPEPKTPDAPTIPADPDHSGGSIESEKVEEISKQLILAFMEEIGLFLGDHFDTLRWVQSTSKPRIEKSSYTPLVLHL
jgi:hypothetical protein